MGLHTETKQCHSITGNHLFKIEQSSFVRSFEVSCVVELGGNIGLHVYLTKSYKI